jgi:glucose-1-phosphate thymidylyltransferase
MKALILAAGYATRLYPLTKNFPKPLLPVGGKTILDRLIADLDRIAGIDQHIVVTNDTFAPAFLAWKAESKYQKPVEIVNDGSTFNENRLGAVKDILFTIGKLGIREDLLVLAGDNVVDFSFSVFIRFALDSKSTGFRLQLRCPRQLDRLAVQTDQHLCLADDGQPIRHRGFGIL